MLHYFDTHGGTTLITTLLLNFTTKNRSSLHRGRHFNDWAITLLTFILLNLLSSSQLQPNRNRWADSKLSKINVALVGATPTLYREMSVYITLRLCIYSIQYGWTQKNLNVRTWNHLKNSPYLNCFTKFFFKTWALYLTKWEILFWLKVQEW